MADNAVGDAGITERYLMVLIVEEFLDEELLEFKPSAWGVGRVAGLPIIAGFVHVGQLKEMAEGGSDHRRIRDWLMRLLEKGTTLLLQFEVLGQSETVVVWFIEVN